MFYVEEMNLQKGLGTNTWIYKKVKDIKKGKFCDCGCSECPSKIKCHKD